MLVHLKTSFWEDFLQSRFIQHRAGSKFLQGAAVIGSCSGSPLVKLRNTQNDIYTLWHYSNNPFAASWLWIPILLFSNATLNDCFILSKKSMLHTSTVASSQHRDPRDSRGVLQTARWSKQTQEKAQQFMDLQLLICKVMKLSRMFT